MLPAPPLLIITDRKQATRPLDAILDAAFAAGCRWASLREKDLPATGQIALLQVLMVIARRHGALLTLHGDHGLAAAAGADGVHLSADGDPTAARTALGPRALIGLSIHSLADTAKLVPGTLDYAIAGPAYVTESKPGYGPALGPAGLAAIAQAARVPVVALGGIGVPVAAEIMRAGAAGIAVMGGVMRAGDPGEEVRAMLATLTAYAPR